MNCTTTVEKSVPLYQRVLGDLLLLVYKQLENNIDIPVTVLGRCRLRLVNSEIPNCSAI